jgi:hypothetical protein
VWCAAATAALALSLSLPEVERVLAPGRDALAAVGLVRDLVVAASAGAVLYLADTVAGARRPLRRAGQVAGSAVGALAALHVAGAASDHPVVSGAELITLLLAAVQLVANARCLAMCWRHGRGAPPPLAYALGLMGLGSALALPYWSLAAAPTFAPGFLAIPVVPLLPPLQCLLSAAAVLVSTAATAHRALSDARTIWRLWPFWRALIDAVPEAALNSARSRLHEVVRPGCPRRFLMYRKLIEIRDAILVVGRHIDAPAAAAAHAHVARARLPEPLAEAAVLACLIREGSRARLAGGPACAGPCGVTGPPIDNLDQEKAFLLRLAAAYDSPAARAFRAPRPVSRTP